MGLFLILRKRKQILEIVSEGKGTIPCGLIIGMESFFLTPENDFWERTELFSFNGLNQSDVNDVDYENSKYLYHTLKMRNLGNY